MDSVGFEGWEQYAEDWYHLFDTYFFTKTAQQAVRKVFMLAEALRGPDVQQLAPLHGPLVREQCWKLMAKYEAWTEQKLRKDTRRDFEVLVMYASAYGHTKSLAAELSRGLVTSGVRVVDMDLEHTTTEDVAKALETCDGFCIGSPTLGGEMPSQVKSALGVVLSSNKKIPCGVFGSYGWSGEAVDELQFRLKDSGFPIAFDPIRAVFRPTKEILDLCNGSGVRMSQKLSSLVLAKRKSQARDVANVAAKTASGGALVAFGKMRTSQCVMSSMDSDGHHLLTTVSWLNQASFEPPGLTLAIPNTKKKEESNLSVDKQLGELLSKYQGQDAIPTSVVRLVLETLFGSALDSKAKEEIGYTVDMLDLERSGDILLEELRGVIASGEPLRMFLERRLKDGVGETQKDASKAVDHFVINMVPENGDALAMANEAQAHKKVKSQNGCLVLDGVHSFLECKVHSSLEAGDHLILYATVQSGQVLDEKEKTDMKSVEALQKASSVGGSGPVRVVAMTALTSSNSSASVHGGSTFAGRSNQGAVLARPAKQHQSRSARTARGGEAELSDIKMWTGLTPGKEYRLQTMSIESVAKDTSTIRSLDPDRDRFDIEFALERGTTYNSYIIKGEKTALVDTSHAKFKELYFDALKKEVDLAQLDYLVVSHTEPDHSGLVEDVIQRAAAAGNDKLVVVGSKMCIAYLEKLVFTPFKSQIVQNNTKIDLGGGHELEFIIAPNLHWPDTMFTLDHATGMLFTCDAFGMHYCSDNAVDSEGVDELLPHYSLYYDCLMKPNARSVLTALKKISEFDITTVAVGHGPILTLNPAEFIEKYRTWSEKATEKLGPSVAVFWVSNFGQSERLSQLYAHGLTSCSVNVEMHDLNAVDAFEITECVARNEVIAIMAPPQGTAASANISNIIANVKPKKHQFMIMDSNGGEAQESIGLLRNRFLTANIPEAMPAMEVKEGNVTTQVMQGYEEAGMMLGKKVTQQIKASAAKKQDKDLAKALGRLSSSLYIATAKKAGVRHAMVASWVTPASAEPLGISLTIAKDRAMEPLLRIGDSFTLNILEEGKPSTLQLMKHFLQKFAPGVDRLDGVECFEGSNGAAVLRGACAYIECKIIARMDASDHWVGYAEVTGGTVANPEAVAAVHHRKIGTYY